MSEFSDLLKRYMDDAAISAYQLSQLCGVERTTIYRVSRGTRQGSAELVEAVAPYLQLSKNEKQALLESLKIEKIGKSVYQNRVAIRDLFSEIFHWYKRAQQEKADFSVLQNLKVNLKDTGPVIELDSENEVELCLISLLQTIGESDKQAEVYSNSLNKAWLIQSTILKAGNISGKYLPFFQYIQLEKTIAQKVVSNNMQILHAILPFAVIYPGTYEAYYTYTTANQTMAHLFPYYVIAGDYVLYMAEDYQRGLFLRLPEYAETLKKEIARVQNQYSCLLHRKIIDKCEEPVCFQEKPDFFYEGIPHITLFTDKKFAEDFIKEEERARFISSCQEADKLYEKGYQFFSDEKIKDILSGKEQPRGAEKFQLSLDEKCRKRMAQNIRHRLLQKNRTVYVLKESSLPTTPGLQIGLQRRKKLIVANQAKDGRSFYVNVAEQSICNAFEDFFEMMNQADILLKKEAEDKIFLKWL